MGLYKAERCILGCMNFILVYISLGLLKANPNRFFKYLNATLFSLPGINLYYCVSGLEEWSHAEEEELLGKENHKDHYRAGFAHLFALFLLSSSPGLWLAKLGMSSEKNAKKEEF